MTDHDSFAERGRALEEDYFRKKDRELVERMRQAAAAEASRAELGRVTGLSDPALLKELQELGFTSDTVSLLPLVPVLEIAWAEGGVTPAERQMLLELARQRGIDEASPAERQLQQWMTTRPDSQVFERATRLISAVLDTGQERHGLTADDLVTYCEQIAAASGGIFGTRLRSVSAEEHALLQRIAGDLKTRHK